jgi:DNA polymerase-3 subunit delta
MAAKHDELKPVYLILSEQPMLVDEALDRLKKRVGDSADLDFNMQVFDGESADVGEVIVAANTFPFASDRRLVIVRGIEKLGKEALDELAAYVANPSETTVMALAGAKLARNTRLYKAVEKVDGLLERKIEKRNTPREVERMFAAQGKQIDSSAAEVLVQSAGFDLRKLSVEVSKVVAFVGDRENVTGDDIEQVVSNTADTSVFELLDALGNRQAAKALLLLGDLIGQGESVYGIHAMALRQLRDLIAARAMIDRGEGSPAQIARVLGRPDWQVRNLPRQARAFSSEELVGLVRAAAEGEAQMKTSQDARLVLERWIVKFCGAESGRV